MYLAVITCKEKKISKFIITMKSALQNVILYAGLTIVLTGSESCAGHRSIDQDEAEALRIASLEKLRHGQTFVRDGDFDAAISISEEKGDTNSVLELSQLAAIRMRWLDKRDSAAVYLTNGLKYATETTSPNVSDLNMDLSALYSHPLFPKDYRKAIHYAERAIETDVNGENRARALHDIGLCYEWLGEHDKAVEFVDSAISLTPVDDGSYATFALNYSGLKNADFDKALKYLDGIGGEHLGKVITLGFLYLNRGERERAKEYLRDAERIYAEAPGYYSINTFNNLRILRECVGAVTEGRVNPAEGTERNDSVSMRMWLNHQLETERTTHSNNLRINLIESEKKRLLVWFTSIVVVLIVVLISILTIRRSQQRFIKVRRELDAMRQKQIIDEATADDENREWVYDIIRKRAEMCVDRFRSSGLAEVVLLGESEYDKSGSYLPKGKRNELQHKLVECFSDFIIDLKMDAGKLSMDDIITSVLSLTRMSNAAIAACLGTTDGAVRTRKTRLRGKLSAEMSRLILD